jgi:coproporphyrinogen III oxidase-like Fe-S oxidoreductase
VLSVLREVSKIDAGTEISLEMDPGTFDSEKVKEYQEVGVTRMSMGVQTMQENEFSKLGRGHDFIDIRKSLDALVSSGFPRDQISVDLMMGLPD